MIRAALDGESWSLPGSSPVAASNPRPCPRRRRNRRRWSMPRASPRRPMANGCPTAAPTTSSATARSTRIDVGNVAQLGLAWSYDLDTPHRVQESTPLVIDGVMYVTSAWSKLFALDARTGKEKWMFDPKVPGEAGVKACCDVAQSRCGGVERQDLHRHARRTAGRGRCRHGQAGLGSHDGARPVRTTPSPARRACSTARCSSAMAAPSTARAATSRPTTRRRGKQLWRFYTVPGDPAQPFEHAALEKAAKTWTGEWWKLRRRRHGVGFHRLRPEARSGVRRCRQRQPVEPEAAQPEGRRQPLSIFDRRAQGRRPANTSGTSRPRRARPGTTRPRSP